MALRAVSVRASARIWHVGPETLRTSQPASRTPVADTTGAGDAFTAALIASLDQLEQPEQAARLSPAARQAVRNHCEIMKVSYSISSGLRRSWVSLGQPAAAPTGCPTIPERSEVV
jgi:pyridoxal/pyridoxine/pyridoxamine kinase